MTFDKWLLQSTELSESSIYKYTHSITTISNDMLGIKIIDKPLSEMELYEIDLAISVIFRTGYFLDKDKKGNHMYSSALKWYRCFVELNSKNGTAFFLIVRNIYCNLLPIEYRKQNSILRYKNSKFQFQKPDRKSRLS